MISTIESKPQWAARIIKRYETPEKFLTLFNPDNQSKYYMNDLKRCFVGSAPSLTRVKVAFDIEVAKNWLIAQLIDLCLFTGIKEKPEIRQIESITDTIICNYGFLKVTELMVFFQRFKAGKHGVFYGAIDGIVITKAIKEFLVYRKNKLIEFERSIE